MKNKFLIATLFSAFLLFSPNVKAANFTDNQTVDTNKTWTVKFTGEVGFDALTKQGITVTDSKGDIVTVGIKLGQDNKTVIVTAPQGGYTVGESYILNIGTKTHSSKGKSLKNAYKLNFNVKANDSPTVNTINDINLNQFKIDFNTEVDANSAEDVRNYKIDGLALDSSKAVAKLENDGKTVLITLLEPKNQSVNSEISVESNILTKDKIKNVTACNQEIKFIDNEIPILKSVSVDGNNKLIIEFSEAVNVKDMDTLTRKFKIDGQSITSYGLNTNLSRICDYITDGSVSTTGIISGATKTWTNKVEFFLDTTLPSGTRTLSISPGMGTNILSDAAGFPIEKSSIDFTIDVVDNSPKIVDVRTSSEGVISIQFDKPMDEKTALDPNNYRLNGYNLAGDLNLTRDNLKLEKNGYIVEITGAKNKFKSGSNIIDIINVKDTLGNSTGYNKSAEFMEKDDEGKPKVVSAASVDNQTIRIKFNKNMKYEYAINRVNYKLLDSKGVNISNHIKEIKSSNEVIGDTDTYDVKLYKTAGEAGASSSYDDSEYFCLTGKTVSLKIKNLVDTAVSANMMDEYTATITSVDNIAPKVEAVYGKYTIDNTYEIIIYFSEEMDSSIIENPQNYKYTSVSGNIKNLPSGAELRTSGDNKSVVIEFPLGYVIYPEQLNNSDNIIKDITVSNVKDEGGNLLDGVSIKLPIQRN